MKKRKDKKKPKYGFFSCVIYSVQITWKTARSVAVSALCVIPIVLILNTIGLYLPSIILKQLESKDFFLNSVFAIIAILTTQMLFALMRQYIDIKRADAEHFVLMKMDYDRNVRSRDMDYYLRMDENYLKIFERASNVTQSNHTAGVHFIEYFANMTINILSFLLFGTMVTILNPFILILLVAGCVVNYYMAKWQNKKNWVNRDDRNIVNKKLNYIAWTVSNDLGYGKDIRLFKFSDYLDQLIETLEGLWYKETKKTEKNGIVTAVVNFLVILIRDGLAYIYLINQAIRGELDSAQFVLYFSAITQLSGFISGILNTITFLQDGAMSVSDYREFFDIKDKLNRGEGCTISKVKPLSIEFRNVSYRYPRGEKKVLDNVSFKINGGEKIALVGSNGAGKTTLTLLMCGILIPDEGEVLIDGHTVYEYNRDELYEFFSLVPQNYSLLPFSIAENISLKDVQSGELIDMEKLERCIETVGLSEKIKELPLGVNTPLNKQVNSDATELSGGEIQKLLLARAMYREAPILILDEPTAALDPIAEDKLYRKYNEFSKNVTAVFISHRLASTRFCDRIFFLDDANIAEVGTHDELMKLNGKYRYLFDVQAQYYKETITDEI